MKRNLKKIGLDVDVRGLAPPALLTRRRRPRPASTLRSWIGPWTAGGEVASRELKVQYEVALTLRAMAATGYAGGEKLALESDAILELLGVVSLPAVPLP